MPSGEFASDSPSGGGPFGALLREWRGARRFSQLQLALEAEISARHLSYLETGRARPSREMVARLAEALGLPLRERNALLVAAGFAAHYGEGRLFTKESAETSRTAPGSQPTSQPTSLPASLPASAMARVREAVDLILLHQEPFPAFVLDRYWNVLLTNRAAARCTARLLGREPGGGEAPNMLRLLLAPGGLRPHLVNWEETAEDLVRHLHQQVSVTPADERLRALLTEVLGLPGVPPRWRRRELDRPAAPLLTTHFRRGDLELRYFSTFTHFATAQDVALDELRIECSFPADDATAARSRELFGA